MRRLIGNTIAIVSLFLLLAVVSTWPLAMNPAGLSLAPAGAGADLHFSTWVIFWGAHAFVTNPLELHSANIYHPEPYTFAYSDIALSNSLLMMPFILIFNDPELIYNLLAMASIILGGTGFYLLALRLTGSRTASVIGALVFIFNPAHFGRIYQIQLFTDHWLPWLALAALRWFDELGKESGNPLRWAAASALLYALHALTGSHNAVFGALLLALLIAYNSFASRLWLNRRFWTGLIVMGVLAVLVLLPVFYPYFILQKTLAAGRVFSKEILISGSTDLNALLAAGSDFYRWLDASIGWPSAGFESPPKAYLFPGIAALALAVFGLARRGRKGDTGENRAGKWTAWILDVLLLLTCWAAAITAFGGGIALADRIVFSIPAMLPALTAVAVFSLRLWLFGGTRHVFFALAAWLRGLPGAGREYLFWLSAFIFFFWTSFGPGAGLYELVGFLPLIGLIRVVNRFVLPAYFAISVLAAYGSYELIRRKSGSKRIIVVLLVIGILAVESSYVPMQVHPIGQTPQPYRWLGEQEGSFAIYEHPNDEHSAHSSVRQMIFSLEHWKKLIVGYSGYRSPEYVRRITRINETFPADSCLDELSNLSVRFVLVHESELTAAELQAVERQTRLKMVREFGDITVYRLE